MRGCILIKTQGGKFSAVLREVSKMNGVKTAFSSMGRTDVVALVEVGDLRAFGNLALKIGEVDGVAATETLIGLEV